MRPVCPSQKGILVIRKRIWILAFGLLVLLASASYAMADVLSGEAEVRINARRLDDGRTEFALQQRVDGEWGERQLPSARFFPANPGDDGWKNSSPLTIMTEATESTPAAQTEDLSEELAAAEADAAEARQALAAAEAALAEALTEAPIHRTPGESAYDEGRFVTAVSYAHQQFTPTTELRIRADGEFGLRDKPLTIVVTCHFFGTKQIWFRNAPPPVMGVANPSGWVPKTFLVSYRFSPSPETGDVGAIDASWNAQQRRGQDEREYSYQPSPSSELRFFWTLRAAEQLEIEIVGADDETVTATFSMAGVWETPIQSNFDRCGDYY